MCADLHCSWTGSCDPLPNAARDEYLRVLALRLHRWQPSDGLPWHAYDEAVRAMVVAVLDLYEREMR
jgi:hypothetical protein